MTNLFYNIVTMITELITGIDSSAMTIWEFQRYVFVSHDVTLLLNAAVALIISMICLATLCYVYYKIDVHSNNKQQKMGD